jgi:hypothetical protein
MSITTVMFINDSDNELAFHVIQVSIQRMPYGHFIGIYYLSSFKDLNWYQYIVMLVYWCNMIAYF